MKKYKSVVAMVKDFCDPDFTNDVTQLIKINTVYVYQNVGEIQIFSELKIAKKYAQNRCNKPIKWVVMRGIWSFGDHVILKKKVIKA